MTVWSPMVLTVTLLFLPLSLSVAESIPVVRNGSAFHPRQPQAVVDESGTVFVAFGSDESLYVCKSTDRGRTYGDPILVGKVRRLALGARRGPRIVAGHGRVVVSAVGHEDGNLLAWYSRDGGESWSSPIQVNDSAGHASEGLHAMALGHEGQVYCVWLDHRNGATQIYGCRSRDGGKTWDRNECIYASPDGNVCECCHPSVTYSASGDLYVMWRNSLAGCRDMYFSFSEDGGSTFSTAQKLGQGSWELDACPMDGGCIIVSTKERVTTVWRRESEVFRASSGGAKEDLLGTGVQPWAAASADGTYFIWLGRRPGDLWIRRPADVQPRKLAEQANDPVVAAHAGGQGPVVALWEATEPGHEGIWAEVINDGT